MIDLRRRLLVAAGSLFVALAVLGVVLPLLPTTPFLLLSAACYARSSDRFYQWLLNNKYLGSYIRNYREGRGIPLRAKVVSLSLLWITIGYTAAFALEALAARALLVAIAAGVTIHIARFPTLR